MNTPLSYWKSLIFAGSLLAAGYTPMNALAADVNINFATNGPAGNLNSPEFIDSETGLRVQGLYLNDSWQPANLYRRNQPGDLGFGICNPIEAAENGGDCPGPEWFGIINELDDRGQRELIVLELPQGYEWVSVGISSMDDMPDTNFEGMQPERGQLYIDSDGVPNSNLPNNAGDTVISQFEGRVDQVNFHIPIAEANASAPFLIFEPVDWRTPTGEKVNNDYLVAQATIREVSYARLGDRVWEDRNNDGIQNCADTNQNGIIGDAGDTGAECNAGIANVSVNLGMPDGLGSCVPMGESTTTNEFGFYEFNDLTPDNYCVVVDKTTIAADFCSVDGVNLGDPQFTIQGAGADAVDSDVNPENGESYSVSLMAGDVNLGIDAGLYCPAKLGDRVWLDQDANGLQDMMEPGVSGVTVNLLNCGDQTDGTPPQDASIVQTTVTNGTDGLYMFGGQGNEPLLPGNYAVEFVKPNGLEFTMSLAGSSDVDSDANQGTGRSACMSLSSREFNPTVDAGLVPKVCNIEVDKTCLVPPMASDSFRKCKGKLQQFTVSWHGDGPIVVNGLGKTNLAVNVGDEVTFTGPFDRKNVYIDISGAVTGKSKFHVSCSDKDFNDPSDCGKYAGDGKGKKSYYKHKYDHDDKHHDKRDDDYKRNDDDDKDYDRDDKYDGHHDERKHKHDYINKWKLEGFVDKKGRVLDCSPDSAGMGSNACMIKLPKAPSCETLGKAQRLTFLYTGNGAVSECTNNSASQSGKKSPTCSGNLASGATVTLSINKGSVSTATVAPGEEFTISGFGSNTSVTLTGIGGVEVNEFHTSCSAPLEAGDVFGNLELVAFDGQRGSTDVTYNYKVTNVGDVDVMNIIVNDDMLGGQVTGSPVINALGAGESITLTEIMPVFGTVTNVATVTAETAVQGMCSAMDSVTVTAVNEGGSSCNTSCKCKKKHQHKNSCEHKNKCDHKKDCGDKHQCKNSCEHKGGCDYKKDCGHKHQYKNSCEHKDKCDHKKDCEDKHQCKNDCEQKNGCKNHKEHH